MWDTEHKKIIHIWKISDSFRKAEANQEKSEDKKQISEPEFYVINLLL